MRSTCLAALFVFTVPLLAFAQHSPSVSLPSQEELDRRATELKEWLADYRHWEAWTQKWANKIAYNAAGGILKNRPERPEPPEWVRDECRDLLAAEGQLGEACEILAHWDDPARVPLTRRHVGVSPTTDVQVKSSFLQRIHLSAGWVPAQMPAPKVYLVAGMNVGVVEVGRATLPAVGVGLIALSDGTGGYEWKPATVLGIGYRLASFPFPGIKRQANLHINIARVTIHGARTMAVGLDPSQNLVGFSLTFNKAR
jgi:hypothetical protein